jgi:hypothetical protein
MVRFLKYRIYTGFLNWSCGYASWQIPAKSYAGKSNSRSCQIERKPDVWGKYCNFRIGSRIPKNIPYAIDVFDMIIGLSTRMRVVCLHYIIRRYEVNNSR